MGRAGRPPADRQDAPRQRRAGLARRRIDAPFSRQPGLRRDPRIQLLALIREHGRAARRRNCIDREDTAAASAESEIEAGPTETRQRIRAKDTSDGYRADGGPRPQRRLPELRTEKATAGRAARSLGAHPEMEAKPATAARP